MQIETFHDEATSTFTYVVFEPESGDAVVIDPVLALDTVESRVSAGPVEKVAAFLEAEGLKLHLILETHAHADHLSGAQELKARFPGARLAIGRRITEVQQVFQKVFELPADFATDGSQFDLLLEDGEVVEAGKLAFEVISTPGHTPACVTYLFEDAIFTGDALFMPDMGTGRCDFPGGSAEDLYDSITGRLYALPDETRVFVGHDYQPGGRELAWETTLAAQKASNVQLPASRSRADFVAFRSQRDAGLSSPRLLFQSVQVNVGGGRLLRYFKIPVNVFRPEPAPKGAEATSLREEPISEARP
ncbi:MAG: MBL fold metallo-hydrolase [Deltaproteobacteria bacterium]|nr:MBL fold metallo-hydrolase [Deltaproteobacteria bacterium]